MAIQNNTNLMTVPINTGKLATLKKAPQTSVSEIVPVTKKAKSADFSMVLSEKQKDALDNSLGYDQPNFKQRGALESYQKVFTQEKRDAIVDSMSFHFVV
jgi:hypothetical protein